MAIPDRVHPRLFIQRVSNLTSGAQLVPASTNEAVSFELLEVFEDGVSFELPTKKTALGHRLELSLQLVAQNSEELRFFVTGNVVEHESDSSSKSCRNIIWNEP